MDDAPVTEPEADADLDALVIETGDIEIARLKPHPRNYNHHPPDQIEHLAASIRQFGFFRNIVIARDDTILAGHGAIEAARTIGRTRAPFKRLDLDPYDALALKAVAIDNELQRFAAPDDRALSELLRDIREQAIDGLVGTGYTDQILANLLMVTRPAHEIASMDEAGQWLGMPEFTTDNDPGIKVVVHCESEAARDEFIEKSGLIVVKKVGQSWAAPYPPRGRDDSKSVFFDG